MAISRGCPFQAGLLLSSPPQCVVPPPSLSSPASITSALPRQPTALNPHQSTKVRRKSKAPCSWLSRSQRPGASRGTGCSLRPWPWLLLLLRLAGRRGCLTSAPDFTGAVVHGTDPSPGHHAAAGSVPTPAGLGVICRHAGGCACSGNVSELFFVRAVNGLIPAAPGELRNAFAQLCSPAAKGRELR